MTPLVFNLDRRNLQSTSLRSILFANAPATYISITAYYLQAEIDKSAIISAPNYTF